MINALPLFHCITGCKVVVVGQGDAAEARRRLVERAGGIVVNEAGQGVRLGFVAQENPEAAAQALRDAGLLVNVADRPDLCDFIVPAIVDRAPVMIAISTKGASAGLAKALRLRLEALLPAGLGALARGLAEVRTILRQRYPDARIRRQILDIALAEGGALDPLRDEFSPDDDALSRLANWLASDNQTLYKHTIINIRLRSNDPEDLTLREARWLGCADIVTYEATVGPKVIARARADAAHLVIKAGENTDENTNPGVTVVLRSALGDGL